jgi:hypothetical protein
MIYKLVLNFSIVENPFEQDKGKSLIWGCKRTLFSSACD